MRRPALLALATLLSACAQPDGSGAALMRGLEEARAATEKYKDVAVALADGYVRDPLDACETPAHLGAIGESGAMGIHYLRRDLLGIGEDQTRLDATGMHTDFKQPGALLYEPQADGSLELVAVENVISAAAWKEAGHRERPDFHGFPFAYMPDVPAMSVRANYDMHLWLFRDNPMGVFAAFNPKVSCEHHAFHMPGMIHP